MDIITSIMISTPFNRRTFIRYSAAVGTGVSLASIIHRAASAQELASADENLPWYRKPLRILQTVLREPDAAEYNATAVVEYMKKSGCNTLVINGGGIVDFFQNPLPAANINSFMGTRDILKEITSACRSEGIRVIARVDFRGVEEKIYQQFPGWFSVDHDGKPRQLTYTRPQLYASCYNGYHRNEHAQEFIRYIMKHYNLDGIWHNSIGVQGVCYCDRCKDLFRSATGESIPIIGDTSDEMIDLYMRWKATMADRHMEKMKQTVKESGHDKVYTAEVFSMFEAGSRINDGIDLYNARDHFDFLVSVAFLTENTDVIHYADLNYANTIIKFLKSMAPEKEAIILYGGNGTSHRYIMDPSVDLKVWLWQALAAGGRFWNCNFTGSHPDATYDRRNAFHQSDAYLFVKQHEKVLTQHAAVATIGIYYSRATRQSFRKKAVEQDHFESFIKGFESVLTENHIPHDFIADDQVTSEKLDKYRLVILPNVRCLSEEETLLLKEYVGGGGNLLATYETGLYHSDGSTRKDFSLAEVFGCHFTGEKINTRKDCYQFIADPDHVLVSPDSAQTELLINAGYTLLCKLSDRAKAICTYVPVVHNQPPEKAWADQWSREFPTVVEHVYNKGRVIYFANQPDLVSYEMGHPDMRNLLLRSIRHLGGDSIPVETDAPASVHIGLTRSLTAAGEYIFSLVNTTSGPIRPLRALVPVRNIKVSLNLGGRLRQYKVLRAQGKTYVKGEENVNIEIENLVDYFAIHITMVR